MACSWFITLAVECRGQRLSLTVLCIKNNAMHITYDVILHLEKPSELIERVMDLLEIKKIMS